MALTVSGDVPSSSHRRETEDRFRAHGGPQASRVVAPPSQSSTRLALQRKTGGLRHNFGGSQCRHRDRRKNRSLFLVLFFGANCLLLACVESLHGFTRTIS